MRLAGTRVLITGASSGIGRATAFAFADAGCRLLLTGRDTARLGEVAAATGGEQVVADITDAADLSRLVEAASRPAVPEVIVHSAGIGHEAEAAEQSADDLERLFAVNVLAPIRLTAALLPAMVGTGTGRIVFVGSIAGELGVAGESAYAASKSALGTYAASLRAELGGRGIGVTTVLPGVVDTEFFENRGSAYRRTSPRPIPPEKVATAIRHAVEADRTRITVPRWLAIPMALKACAPQLYARFAARWG